MSNLRDAALQHAASGWRVFPVGQDKIPKIKGWVDKATCDASSIRRWWSKWPDAWIGGATGQQSGLVVLDIDVKNDAEGMESWRVLKTEHGDPQTLVHRTPTGGFHLVFVHPGGQVPNAVGLWPGIDFRGDGGYVVLPPSGGYEVLRPREVAALPAWLRQANLRGVGGASSGENEHPSGRRTKLVDLLNAPPEEGNRNDWLAQVCGHWAKLHHDKHDLYEHLAWEAAAKTGLDDAECEKTIESIWRTEQGGGQERALPDDRSGWLVGAGSRILCPSKDDQLIEWAPWDMRVLRVLVSGDKRTYEIQINYDDGKAAVFQLSHRILANPQMLRTWLAGHGCDLVPKPKDSHRMVAPPGTRLLAYLNSQAATTAELVPTLGHNGKHGFVTWEGVITDKGLCHETLAVPDPALAAANLAPYSYGFEGEDTARSVLTQVLTFQEADVCAVFGAWWAACMLKPQIQRQVSIFPNMVIEAASESGKTTGFFALMLELAGCTEGPGDSTYAAMRDRVAAHRSGIVWIDDMDSLARLERLLRQAPTKGSVTKKGEDRHTNELVQLVAPIVVSGEAVASIEFEKAQLDRMVRLQVPSPVNRKSLIQADRLQWHDIVDLREQYPDLTVFAGHFVQWALGQTDLCAKLPSLRVGSGRHGDKMAVLRLGARLLAHLAQADWVIERVDEWCQKQVEVGTENMLSLQVLPDLLRARMWPRSAKGRPPCWIDEDGTVCMSVKGVVHEYLELNRSGISERTRSMVSESSIRNQLRAMGVTTTGTLHTIEGEHPGRSDDTRKKARYVPLPPGVSRQILERSEAGSDDEAPAEPGRLL